MARQEIKEDGVEESAKRMETLGDAFPGLAPVIDGVNVHKLALGHLADFVAIAIAFEIEKAKKKAAYGISAKDEEEKHRAAQATGAAEARKAFNDGLLPSNVPSEAEHIFDAAVAFVEHRRDTTVKKSRDPEAALKEWYETRYSEDERSDSAKPRNQSRANCVKRTAREWLANSGLSGRAAEIRDEVVAEGKKAYQRTLEDALAHVAHSSKALLSPFEVTATTVTHSSAPEEDAGF